MIDEAELTHCVIVSGFNFVAPGAKLLTLVRFVVSQGNPVIEPIMGKSRFPPDEKVLLYLNMIAIDVVLFVFQLEMSWSKLGA